MVGGGVDVAAACFAVVEVFGTSAVVAVVVPPVAFVGSVFSVVGVVSPVAFVCSVLSANGASAKPSHINAVTPPATDVIKRGLRVAAIHPRSTSQGAPMRSRRRLPQSHRLNASHSRVSTHLPLPLADDPTVMGIDGRDGSLRARCPRWW